MKVEGCNLWRSQLECQTFKDREFGCVGCPDYTPKPARKPKSFEERLVELVSQDPELHEALVELIEAKTRAAIALAEWRDRRNRT